MKKPVFSLAALLILAPISLAQNGATALQNGDFSSKTTSWLLPAPAKAQAEIVAAPDSPALAPKTALRLNITPIEGEKPWGVILRQRLGGAWKKGAPLRLRAWMRSPQSLKVLAFVEAGAPDYQKSVESETALSPEWKAYEWTGELKSDVAAGEISTGFHLGYGAGTVEITGVSLLSNELAPVTNLQPLPAPNAISLIENGDFAGPLEGKWTPNGPFAPKLERIPTGGPTSAPNPAFLRLQVAPPALARSWDARLTAPKTAVAIPANSLVAVRFWARSPQNLRVAAIFQQAVEPFDKTISKPVTLSPEWAQYRFWGTTKTDLPAQNSNFEFHVGFGTGTIDLANVRVENFGSLSEAQIEGQIGAQSVDFWGDTRPDETWKIAARERIERHRKADLKIRVVDKRGQPLANQSVKIAQTRQKFRFGTAVVAGRLLDKENPDNLRYQAEIARLFNTVVFENDLKWDNRNPRKTEQALEALKWLHARKIEARGHTLVWGSRRNLPPEAAALWDKPEELRALVRQRVRDQVRTFKGQLYVWDAVNEAVTNTELWELLGWDEFANVYKIARQEDPNVRLAYNDYNISNENQSPLQHTAQRKRVAELIRMLQKSGAPLDIYGDQAHFGTPLTRPARLIEIWNEAAKLGLPIEITEFDAGIQDDELHGKYVADALLAAFSVPQVESFILWGFWEGAHWRAKEGGAMFRRDWSKRPAQIAFENLVLRDWKTDVTLKTDKDGVVQTRGFLGDYQLQIGGQKRAFQLEKSGFKTQIALS